MKNMTAAKKKDKCKQRASPSKDKAVSTYLYQQEGKTE
jgi:hypothetical protein